MGLQQLKGVIADLHASNTAIEDLEMKLGEQYDHYANAVGNIRKLLPAGVGALALVGDQYVSVMHTHTGEVVLLP